jgi:hypothetical protein
VWNASPTLFFDDDQALFKEHGWTLGLSTLMHYVDCLLLAHRDLISLLNSFPSIGDLYQL